MSAVTLPMEDRVKQRVYEKEQRVHCTYSIVIVTVSVEDNVWGYYVLLCSCVVTEIRLFRFQCLKVCGDLSCGG